MDKTTTLPDTSRLGIVELRVTEVARAMRVWRDLVGLQILSERGDHAVLGIGGRPLIVLQGGASPPADGPVKGLFHVAIHVPARADLARVLLRLRAEDYRHSGQDHFISESLYFSDYDGNGIEIALDTPGRGPIDRSRDVPVGIAADGSRHSLLAPLDLDGVAAALPSGANLAQPLPDGTHIGHIHFRTKARDAVFTFYTETLGFRPNVNSAAFKFCDVGTNIRNHMIAFNHWAGLDLPAAAPNSPGVVQFSIIVPDQAAFSDVKNRLDREGVATKADATELTCSDPDGNQIVIQFSTS